MPQVSPIQVSPLQVIPIQGSADKSWPGDFCYDAIGITNFKRLLRFRSFILSQAARR
jgi:hypothetical protein